MTAQEIVQIFHAYNNADIKWKEHTYSGDEYWGNGVGHSLRQLEGCQLLLTDLSLISDEHKIAIGVILGYEGSGDGNCKHWAEWFIDSYGFGAKKQGNFHAIRVQQITDQLRLWNYNIGYSKYTAADLVNEGVVILNHENKGI